jgi:hypothetical protein
MCDRRAVTRGSYRKSRLVESVVEGKGRVVRERFVLSCGPQRANAPPIELRSLVFVECRRKKSRGTLRDRNIQCGCAKPEGVRLVN